jgi:adenylosuccinate lyase
MPTSRASTGSCTTWLQDVWTYISMGYFAQVRGQGTVGSSTMPHKVNPIRFENAEANLEVSNALLRRPRRHARQSRLQRDLTDSSMQRNIGTAFGHSLLAIDNVARGLAGLDAVPERWPPTSTRTGRCSASRSSRRCGPSTRAGRARHG